MTRIELEHAGETFAGELLLPDGEGPHPAVMVMHSALGLGENERNAAARLVELGYAALLTDMFGAGFDGDMAKAGQYFAALQSAPERLRKRCVAWFDALATRAEIDAGRIAAIGYCFGGSCVLELARSGADLRATVSLHGILSTHAPAQPGAVGGEIVVWHGEDDPYAPPAQVEAFREEMRRAQARCHVMIFGRTVHAFADPVAGKLGREGIAYDAIADAVSWAGTAALLARVLR